ncbi:MAG: sensor histidine kinase [Clostridiaceae bacterium]|nr:sensor histidine kinase [Clostridiaceae bacterium]
MLRIRFPRITRIIMSIGKMRLSKRAIILFVISVLIPIILILRLYANYSEKVVKNEVSSNMRLAITQLKNNLDYRFEQITESALSILSAAYPYISSGSTDLQEQLNEFSELKLLVRAFEGKHMISKVRLFVPDDKIYANQRDNFYSLLDLHEFQQPETAFQRGVVWLETHGAMIYEEVGHSNVVSCRVTISSRTNYDEIASVLQLDIEETRISKVFTAGINVNEEIYLINSDGVILSHPNSNLIGKKGLTDDELEAMLGTGPAQMTGSLTTGEHLLAFAKLDAVDWYLVMRLPASVIYGTDAFSFNLSQALLTMALLLVIAVALILIYSFVVEKTVRRINKAINEINANGLEKAHSLVTRDLRDKDPLSVLESNANQLVVTIKTLLEQSYQAELKARDYQLKALQAQINPHFLYNTLDAIKWMVLEGVTEDSVWMLNAFSKYFRLSLSKGKDVVRLREEMELVRAYLGIMQKRFKGKFEVKYEIDPAVEDCLIPKLLLQPIVENALQHGIMHSENGSGTVEISARQKEGSLEIIVKDNGIGMTQEQLKTVVSNIYNGSTEGYGLSNVDERLKLFGGDNCGLSISSELNVGTAVKMSLPLKQPSSVPG